MAHRFAKVSEEEIEKAFFYPSDLVNTKTTIPLRVGEERLIYKRNLPYLTKLDHSALVQWLESDWLFPSRFQPLIISPDRHFCFQVSLDQFLFYLSANKRCSISVRLPWGLVYYEQMRTNP